MTANERILAMLLAGTVTVATAIIVAQDTEIQDLKAEVNKLKRVQKIWKKAVLTLTKTADMQTLKETNKMLGNEIAFEQIINDF
jgi:cell division protein FtsL